MSCTLIVEQGNPPVLQTTVRDALTGLPVDIATVLVTINDPAGNPVSGATWPLTVPALGSGGVYQLQLDPAIVLTAGVVYTAVFKITLSGVTITRDFPVQVILPGCGNTPPADSPASPFYQGPPLLQMLNEAERAYHKMQMGGAVVTIKDQNGEEVTYAPANRTALAQYIFSLKAQLGLVNVAPAQVSFGSRSTLFGRRHFR